MNQITRNERHSLFTTLKDPGSAISHFIGTVLAILSMFFLIPKATQKGNDLSTITMLIFCLSLIMLYSASTLYHSIKGTPEIEKLFKKFDHMMIYVLIAGTYTPVCIIALNPGVGIPLFIFIWVFALLGVFLTYKWVDSPKWINSIIYIAMGWAVVFTYKSVVNALGSQGFFWLLMGGIAYTVGGVIYALKLPLFNHQHPNFGTHEIFHIFCIVGSFCHFIVMYYYVANLI